MIPDDDSKATREDVLRHQAAVPESLDELLKRQSIRFFPARGWFVGRVVGWRAHTVAGRSFRVRYTDGTEEEMLWMDLCPKLLPKQPGWKDLEQALSADAQWFSWSALEEMPGSAEGPGAPLGESVMEHAAPAVGLQPPPTSDLTTARSAGVGGTAQPRAVSRKPAWHATPGGAAPDTGSYRALAVVPTQHGLAASPKPPAMAVSAEKSGESSKPQESSARKVRAFGAPPSQTPDEAESEGCPKSAAGRTNFCVAHGGGKRCQRDGCTKRAVGTTPYCVSHGGGKRCQIEGCTKSAQGGTAYCVAHGGGNRCQAENCGKQRAVCGLRGTAACGVDCTGEASGARQRAARNRARHKATPASA
eukprot:gene8690-biopygen8835